MQNWKIDPITGDYVMENGKPVQTNSLQIPAYFRLKIKRQQWLYAPDDNYGSDYFTVKKRPSSNAASRMESIGANALQPLIDDGRASEIELTSISATQTNRNNTGLEVKITDATGEVEAQTFKGLGI